MERAEAKLAAPRPTDPNQARKRLCRQRTAEMYGSNGAGEGIRTLDPNLGKVVLYP